MSMLEQMQFESGLLHVALTGKFSLEEAKRNFRQVLGGVVRDRATKVLLAGRMVKGNPGVHEPLRDPRRFGETVMGNRGMNIKVCETLEEAFAWLELTLPNKAGASDAA